MNTKQLKIEKGLNRMEKRSFLLILCLLMFAGTISAHASEITAQKVLQLTNDARTQAKLPIFKENKLLDSAAKNKAQDMIEYDYFAHISPQGKTPWDFIDSAGYNYRYAGENLALNFTDAQDQQKAWMDSQSHRENILNANYQEVGIAIGHGFIEGHDTTVTVMEFGSPMGKNIVPTNTTAISEQNSKQVVQGASKDKLINNPQKVSVLKVEEPQKSVPVQQTIFAKISTQIKDGEIIKDKKFTLLGCMIFFVVLLVAAFADLVWFLLKHEKHKFVLLETKNQTPWKSYQ